MVPAFGILQPISEVEVKQAYGVDWIEMEVPIASTLCLFANGEGRLIYGAVLEKLLIHVLHLHYELLALVALTIYIEYGTACIGTVAKLLGIKIRDVLNVLLAVKHGVQKADKQLLVELRAEQALKAEICMWIDVFH